MGLHPRHKPLISACGGHGLGDLGISKAAEGCLCPRSQPFKLVSHRAHGGPQPRWVLLSPDDRKLQGPGAGDQRVQAREVPLTTVLAHGGEQALLHVDDDQGGAGSIETVGHGHGLLLVHRGASQYVVPIRVLPDIRSVYTRSRMGALTRFFTRRHPNLRRQELPGKTPVDTRIAPSISLPDTVPEKDTPTYR